MRFCGGALSGGGACGSLFIGRPVDRRGVPAVAAIFNALAGTVYPTFIRSTGATWALGIGRIGSIVEPVIGGVLIELGLFASVLLICAAMPFVACAGATPRLGLTKADVTGRQ